MEVISFMFRLAILSVVWLFCPNMLGMRVLCRKLRGFWIHLATQSGFNFLLIFRRSGPVFPEEGQLAATWHPLQPALSNRVSPMFNFSAPARSLVFIWHLKQFASVYFFGNIGCIQWWIFSQSNFCFHSCFCSGEFGVCAEDTKDVPRLRPAWHDVQPKDSNGWGEELVR